MSSRSQAAFFRDRLTTGDVEQPIELVLGTLRLRPKRLGSPILKSRPQSPEGHKRSEAPMTIDEKNTT